MHARLLILGIANLWHSYPAMQALVPIMMGIYFTYLYTDHSLVSVWILGCGIFLLISSIALGRYAARQPHISGLPQRVYAIGIALTLLALGAMRAELAPRTGAHSRNEEPTLRTTLIERAKHSTLSDEAQRLTSAIALGHLPHDSTSRAMRQSFAESGSAHTLAVSGFHLAMIIGILSVLFGRLRHQADTRALYFCLLIALSWLYCALTSWGVPTVRSAVMLTFVLIGQWIRRTSTLPNTLAASALLQLVITPSLLYSWGMWLSYMAVLSISLYYRPIVECVGTLTQPIIRWLWQALAVSLAAQVLVLPLCLYLFGWVSWSFIFTTLPMTLLSILIIPLALVGYAILALSFPLGFVADLLNVLSSIMLSVARIGTDLDLIQRTRLPLWALIALWLCATLPLLYIKIRQKQKYPMMNP